MGPLRKTRFTENLISLNSPGIQGFSEWVFYPGMLFRSRIAWWKTGGTRKSPHEGLDICFYRNGSGALCSLRSGTVIPATYTGEIVKIEPDFLGKSLFILVDGGDSGDCLYVICGHTEPLSGVVEGTRCTEGEGLASLSDTQGKQSLIPPHLHITVARTPYPVSPAELGWDMLHNTERVTLLNPLRAIDNPFSVLAEL